MKNLLITIGAVIGFASAAIASEEARGTITGASADDIKIMLSDVVGAKSKSNLHRLEGCLLIQETRTITEENPDRPSLGVVAIDLRATSEIVDITNDDELGVDIVRLRLAKGMMDEIENAFQPVKDDAKLLADALATERGVANWDVLKIGDIKEEIAPQILEKLVAGDYGDTANKSFFINGSIISPPLPMTQMQFAPGQGEAVAAAIGNLMAGECAPTG